MACALCLLAMGAAAAADPGPGDASGLASLINGLREAGGECGGQHAEAAPPLNLDERLFRIAAGSSADPMAATRAAGYSPAKVQLVSLGGPADVEEAMALLLARYCPLLFDAQFTDLGVTREGTRWQVVLARPVVEEGLGDWRQAGQAVLAQINQARSEARHCGSAHHEAVAPLRWSEPLARAALAHGRDMAEHNYFGHVSPRGDTLSHRVDETGYAWMRIGENIAAGTSAPAQAVAGWLDSPTHCTTLMNPDFTESGVAYAIDEQSDAVIYWIQVFGTPQ